MARKHRRSQERAEPAPQGFKGSSPIKYVAFGIAALILVFALGQVIATGLSGGSPSKITSAKQPLGAGAAAAAIGNDGIQEVRVTMANGYRYQPDPIRLKIGVPARLVVDLSTVTGCMRSVQIPELGVAKNVHEGDNTIEFTPTRAGTFSMRCSMNMGQGVVVIEDESGQVPAGSDLTVAAPAAGGGCGVKTSGGSGGGCGCGG